MSTVNIQITGIDTANVGQPRNDGTPGSALYRVPFKLSAQAPSEWCELLVHLWNRPPSFSSMHRPGIAEAHGDRIVLTKTTLEEVEQYHKETLKLCVNEANAQYNAYMTKKLQQLKAREEEEERTRSSIKLKAEEVNKGWND